MQILLARGPEKEGIDADEFEAGIELVEVFRAITAALQARGLSYDDPRGGYGNGAMSDRLATLSAVWFEWCRQIGPVATQIVEQVEDASPIRSPVILRLALRRWIKIRRDLSRKAG